MLPTTSLPFLIQQDEQTKKYYSPQIKAFYSILLFPDAKRMTHQSSFWDSKN